MEITIITTDNRRLYPAVVYSIKDDEHQSPVNDVDNIYNLLYKDKGIIVVSNQYDQYGEKIELFEGKLKQNEIKSVYAINNDEISRDLSTIMTLSEAAEKWGLANGSTIRKAIERGKFNDDEIKQAGSVWIVTYNAMERVFGSIKDEENAYIINDDFEFLKAYYEYAKTVYLCGSKINALEQDSQIKYDYLKKIFIEGLKALKNNQKVIIKRSTTNKILQIINTESEYYYYIESYYKNRNQHTMVIDKLIKELKEMPK